MNQDIILFLQRQSCATICCVDKQGCPWCFSCFYAFDAEQGILCFKSSVDSHHAVLMKENPCVAGTILPDKLRLLVVKGIQFEGTVAAGGDPSLHNVPEFFYKKHPMAMAVPGMIWTIRVDHIKLTDSTLGFGKKINWKREKAVLEKASLI